MSTEYIVLRKDEASGRWEDVGRTSQRSANAAIRMALDPTKPIGATIEPGTLVAVPARSWKPVTVKVETKTALKFS